MKAFACGCLVSTLVCSAAFAKVQHGQLFAYLFFGILAQLGIVVPLLGVLVYGYFASLFREKEQDASEARRKVA